MKRFNITKEDLIMLKIIVGRPYIKKTDKGIAYLYRVFKDGNELNPKFVVPSKGRKKPYAAYNITGNTTISAARLFYIWFKGPIPEGFDVDHTDNNSLNNRKKNLQPMSHRDNCMKRYQDDPINECVCKYATYCKLKHQIDLMTYEQFKDFIAKQEELI